MGAKRRVPQKDSEFDTYIRDTTTVLETGTPTGAIRLGLTTAQATQWIAYRDQWIALYPKYTNKATRTATITESKNGLKATFAAFTVKPLLLIEGSDNLSVDDRATFNLPDPEQAKTPRGIITDIPFGKLKGIGSGILEVRARRENDATRSSMHKLADVVEFRYIIVDNNGGDSSDPPTGSDTGTKAGKGAPTADDCPNTVSSKTAFWRINLGLANQGKRIVGFLRWVNLTNPANNSPWSDIMSIVIS